MGENGQTAHPEECQGTPTDTPTSGGGAGPLECGLYIVTSLQGGQHGLGEKE